jgi:hypothetical protein
MALSRSLWQKVRVLMSDAPGTPQNVTAITKDNPGVVTYEGADPADGSYGLFTASGMIQMNNRIARFDNLATGNNVDLESINTTNYGTFTSGTFSPLTFTHEFESLMNPNASGGEPEEIDVSTIHDDLAQVEYGRFSAIRYGFEVQWDPAVAAHVALFEASQLKASRAFQLIFANGRIALIYGAVAFSGVPVGSQIVTSPMAITSRGFPSFYAA